MADPDQLTVSAKFDRQLIFEEGGSARYLVVEAVAPQNAKVSQRRPLNLAVVIDASGSMTGRPLDAAKQAATGVINALGDKDVLSVVSFSSDALIHVDRVNLSKKAKAFALKQIESIITRDQTNLSAGWFAGAECVARVMEDCDDYQNHVLLLSDGYANRGIEDPGELQYHAEQLRRRRVLTSTVGFGNDYSPTQMQAIAEFGGGRMHDAQHPGEIIEVVLAHLDELNRIAVENLEITITFPPLRGIQNLSGFPTNIQNNSKMYSFMGAIPAGSSRMCVFRIACPSGEIEARLNFAVDYTWNTAGGVEQLKGDNIPVSLKFTDRATNSAQPRDITICARVVKIWQAAIIRRTAKMNKLKVFNEARRFLDSELELFVRYCDGLDGCETLVADLLQARKVAHREWDERSMKEILLSSYNTTYSQTDTRVLKREPWSSFLPQGDLDRTS